MKIRETFENRKKNGQKALVTRIDQLDFDEAEILMKRWEGME